MEESLNKLKRTHKCGQLNKSNENEKVTLMGWVSSRRDLGNLTFVYLRDISGDIQVVFNAENLSEQINKKASSLKYEYVVCVQGVVGLRDAKNINADKSTGEIEILAENLLILSKSKALPFMLQGENIGNEALRLEHRYLDMRRDEIKNNLILRSNITKSFRDFLSSNNFLEIETPFLGKSTPEGARDYLVPSRINKGSFYALPQSPQLYKQLLMVGGLDKYYQIAKCFRDEDLRADRQPEFTQVDIEMSFIDDEQAVMNLSEQLVKKIYKDNLNIDVKTPFKKLTYNEAIENYGSDKPDLRFDMKIKDITNQVKDTNFEVFTNTINAGGSVRAINAKGLNNSISRKYIDKLTDTAKLFKAKGLMFIKNQDGELKTSLSKFLTEEQLNLIAKASDLKDNDLLLLVADANTQIACKALGAIRNQIAEKFELINTKEHNFSFVVDFPLFEYSEEDARYYSAHHPFTAPKDEDLHLLETDPASVRAKAYDMVINGQEAGGGSIRISKKDTQQQVFKALGFTKEQIEKQFGFFVNALEYGTPPHGGIAFGLDRFVMLLANTNNIKDVIAFPKIQNASCLMTKAPSKVSEEQLKELNLEIKKDNS